MRDTKIKILQSFFSPVYPERNCKCAFVFFLPCVMLIQFTVTAQLWWNELSAHWHILKYSDLLLSIEVQLIFFCPYLLKFDIFIICPLMQDFPNCLFQQSFVLLPSVFSKTKFVSLLWQKDTYWDTRTPSLWNHPLCLCFVCLWRCHGCIKHIYGLCGWILDAFGVCGSLNICSTVTPTGPLRIPLLLIPSTLLCDDTTDFFSRKVLRM